MIESKKLPTIKKSGMFKSKFYSLRTKIEWPKSFERAQLKCICKLYPCYFMRDINNKLNRNLNTRKNVIFK